MWVYVGLWVKAVWVELSAVVGHGQVWGYVAGQALAGWHLACSGLSVAFCCSVWLGTEQIFSLMPTKINF